MKPRAYLLAAAVLLFLVAVISFLTRSNPLATSSDGRMQFLSVKYQTGTSFSASFGSRPEALTREALYKLGFHNVQQMSFRVQAPMSCHLFIVEYTGDVDESITRAIKASVVQSNGTEFSLSAVGRGKYGIYGHHFAWWILAHNPQFDPAHSQLKVYLPQDHPTLLPIPK